MAPLDPWIIEEIKRREHERRRRDEDRREQPTIPLDDDAPSEPAPEKPDAPVPGVVIEIDIGGGEEASQE